MVITFDFLNSAEQAITNKEGCSEVNEISFHEISAIFLMKRFKKSNIKIPRYQRKTDFSKK